MNTCFDKGSKDIGIQTLFNKDTSFATLMQKRIHDVLLIASRYDLFMLDEDGRIDERLFSEYFSLNLTYPPHFTRATTREEAEELLERNTYELIIVMPSDLKSDFIQSGTWIKAKYPSVPIVLLTPFSKEVSRLLEKADLSGFEYVFSWLGNTELLLAIIKLMEDRMNAPKDVASVGVQVILLVEDSVRFYSSFLPILFKLVLRQSQIFSKEALNENQQMLRMRGRPKILLARSYEEAVEIYESYSENILGIVSDVSYQKGGEKDPKAGIKFCSYVRGRDPFVPIILQSSDIENEEEAKKLDASFVDKNSKKMPVDFKRIVFENFGFGDFIIRDPKTQKEITRIEDLIGLQNQLMKLPQEALIYHASHNHISRWLSSRAIFPLAEFVRKHRFLTYETFEEGRRAIFNAIVQYRRMKNRGIVAVFHTDRYDEYANFARIGDGSMGGKGRGLAFIDSIIKRHPEIEESVGVPVTIPKTVVLCTDVFDEFMEGNDLYSIALSDASDEEILQHFLKGHLPDYLTEDFSAFVDAVGGNPIAVRSSSLLEDSHYQPFAGVYATYMVPSIEDKATMITHLSNAVKAVYASVYYKDSKAYMIATSNLIDQEKMAVVMQAVVGKQYENRFYPSFSGVARSLDFYPIGEEKPEDGIVNLAFGLGKYIVDGGTTLRVSPKYPDKVLQTSTLDLALRDTQTKFNALDLNSLEQEITPNDGFNLLTLPIRAAEKDGSLKGIASTFDPIDEMLRDGIYEGGRKVITFNDVLKNGSFPLSDILLKLLEYGQREMARPVELEFAVNLTPNGESKGEFYWLQIRPIVDNQEVIDEDLSKISQEELFLSTKDALGNGIIEDVFDVIYVKSESFDTSRNQFIAYDLEAINKRMLDASIPYILIGPGRWGSSDSWLGIPVKWPHIAGARVIVETNIKTYRIEPSQGTHFFQNLTSLGVPYLTVDTFERKDFFDEQFLNQIPAVEETQYVRRVHFDKPLVVKVDGKKRVGVIFRPS